MKFWTAVQNFQAFVRECRDRHGAQTPLAMTHLVFALFILTKYMVVWPLVRMLDETTDLVLHFHLESIMLTQITQ